MTIREKLESQTDGQLREIKRSVAKDVEGGGKTMKKHWLITYARWDSYLNPIERTIMEKIELESNETPIDWAMNYVPSSTESISLINFWEIKN